jgi:ABC-type amino acid transport substrate-binding protein
MTARKSILALIALATLVTLAIGSADARAESEPQLKVGVVLSPSFVEKPTAAEPGAPYDGFAIDLWRAVALRLDRKSEFIEYPNFDAVVDAAAKGEIDIAVGDISATADRAAKVDFSYPIADGGLRVMVTTAPKHSLAELWDGLVERGHVRIALYGGAILVGISLLMMHFFRRVDTEFPKAVHEGFAESLYRTVSITMSGKTKVVSTSNWMTKILASIWLVCGVGIVAYITSSVTAVMTAQATAGSVVSVDDLKNKAVGALAGTISERYCWRAGFATHSFASLDDAVKALLAHEVVGIVSDGAVLEAYDHAHPELPITEVGPLFEKHKYAFALPRSSPLRSAIDQQLIGLEESGDKAKLAARYFGSS